MTTKKKTRAASVLIPAAYSGEVTPDEAVSALNFYVLKITLYASDAEGRKNIAEQRNAYFVSSDDLKEAITQAKGLGWGVTLDVAEMGVTRPPAEPAPAPAAATDEGRPRVVVTAENLYDALMAEYLYWLDANKGVASFASGALANVIAYATVEDWRAEWHPAKEPPPPATDQRKPSPWMRFMFRLADSGEHGLFGRIMYTVFFKESRPL